MTAESSGANLYRVSWRPLADTSRTQLFQANGSKHRLYKFQSSLDPVKKNIPKVMKNVVFFHGLGPRVSFVQQGLRPLLTKRSACKLSALSEPRPVRAERGVVYK
jgi:hypothetical protein